MIRGPAEYVPSVEVTVVNRRHAIPLDENEGIYVRDLKNGRVRAIIGETYMLTQVMESSMLFEFDSAQCVILHAFCDQGYITEIGR